MTASPPIIQLLGPEGSGKTTLCRLFLEVFENRSVLAVDASADSFLTLSYGVSSQINLATLLAHIEQHPLSREGMDWALQDLPVAIPTNAEAEILALGNFPKQLTPIQQDLLSYGLPRLLSHYDVVVWDGHIPFSPQVLRLADIRHLLVVTPQDDAWCETITLEKAMVLLSRAEASDSLPPSAARQIMAGNWTFVGKLPSVSTAQERVKALPQYFQDCFHKLDLPFELRPYSS